MWIFNKLENTKILQFAKNLNYILNTLFGFKSYKIDIKEANKYKSSSIGEFFDEINKEVSSVTGIR